MKVKFLSCNCGSKNIQCMGNGAIIYIKCADCDYSVWEEVYGKTNKKAIIKKLAGKWNKMIQREWIEIEYKEIYHELGYNLDRNKGNRSL